MMLHSLPVGGSDAPDGFSPMNKKRIKTELSIDMYTEYALKKLF